MMNESLDSVLVNNKEAHLNSINKNKLRDILSTNPIILEDAKKLLTEGKRYLDSREEIPFKKNLYKARDMFESLFKNGNKDEDLFLGYAESLYIIGEYEKANSVYDEGLRIFPQNYMLKEGKAHVQHVLDLMK